MDGGGRKDVIGGDLAVPRARPLIKNAFTILQGKRLLRRTLGWQALSMIFVERQTTLTLYSSHDGERGYYGKNGTFLHCVRRFSFRLPDRARHDGFSFDEFQFRALSVRIFGRWCSPRRALLPVRFQARNLPFAHRERIWPLRL